MFDLDLSDRYEWPVELSLPDADKGKEMGFTAEFKRFGDKDTKAMLMDIQDIVDGVSKLPDRKLADKVLVGWSGIYDGDKELPFSAANKKLLLDVNNMPAAIARAWVLSVTAGLTGN